MTQYVQKLNLGCGEFKKAGYINLDANPDVKPDVIHNLDFFPYPFKDNSFDVIEADHVFEHLHDVFGAMREVYRILRKDGICIIRVPHFSRGFTHPDHKRGFDVSFHYYFNPLFSGGYAGISFTLEKLKMRWMCQPYLKKMVLPAPVYYVAFCAGKIFDFFANRSPNFCSHFWCFWVGGFEELEYRLRVEK